MRVRHLRTFVLSIFLCLLASGCGKAGGSEYLGKWQNVNNKKDQFEISRNGDNFLITKTEAGFFGKPQTTTVSAVLKDGLLEAKGGFLTVTITYVKATDRLTAPGMLGGSAEYERVK